MSKKSFFRTAFSIIMLITFSIIACQNVIAEQLYCFTGHTYIDGSLQGEVLVTLDIGDHHYKLYSNESGEYAIGYKSDTGDFCLKGTKTLGIVIKAAAHQGTKSTSGTLYYDLYLTNGPKNCTPSK